MSFRKDIIPLQKDFPFSMFRTGGVVDSTPTLHFHDCLEINFIEGGKGVNVIENKKYDMLPGDFYVINNLEHHMGVSDGSLKMLVIVFDPVFVWKDNPMDYEYLRPFFNRSVFFSNRIRGDNRYYSELLQVIKKIDREWMLKEEGYRLVIKSLLMYLLAVLYRHFKLKDEMGDDVISFRKSYDRIRTAVEYINTNYSCDVTLEELSKIALMSRTYFSTYFKSIMNMSVSEYIESLRINNACRLLKTTGKNITEISIESGFNSLSYFNRAFKKLMSISPNEYRKNSKECSTKSE